MSLKIVTTREVARNTKEVFELAEEQRVVVKRGKKYVNFIVSDDPTVTFVSEEWIKKFMLIPSEFRVNPFEVSPSGDLFFADKRNLEHIDKAQTGELKELSIDEQKKLLSCE